MNENALCYFKSCKDLLLPVYPLSDICGFELPLGKKRYFFSGTETPFNDSCSASIAYNKYSTNKLLELAGLPVPKAIAISRIEFEQGKLEERVAELTFPLVVKPTAYGSLGYGVFCNIQTIEQLKEYVLTLFPTNYYLSLEEYHGNLNSYRVLVFKKRVIGVIQRYPPAIVGDGIHTIQEMVELTNRKRINTCSTLGPIEIHRECRVRFEELGVDINHILQQNERITLGYTSNATRGGTYKSLSRHICKKNRKLAVRAATLLNLNLVGIDIECVDINKPIEETQGVIIELNHNPSIRIHENPIKGKKNRVTKKIVRTLICRHPLAYLKIIYKDKCSSIYIKSLILITLLFVIFHYSVITTLTIQ